MGTSGDNLVLLFDVANQSLLQTFGRHKSFVNRLAFSNDGKVLASAGSTIHLWNVESGQNIESLPAISGAVGREVDYCFHRIVRC